jgi:hypothetical protein
MNFGLLKFGMEQTANCIFAMILSNPIDMERLLKFLCISEASTFDTD